MEGLEYFKGEIHDSLYGTLEDTLEDGTTLLSEIFAMSAIAWVEHSHDAVKEDGEKVAKELERFLRLNELADLTDDDAMYRLQVTVYAGATVIAKLLDKQAMYVQHKTDLEQFIDRTIKPGHDPE